MKSFVRNALVAAAGLVALSLSAHAAGPMAVTDTPLLKSTATSTQQMAQYYGTSSGSVGFKKSKKKKKKKSK